MSFRHSGPLAQLFAQMISVLPPTQHHALPALLQIFDHSHVHPTGALLLVTPRDYLTTLFTWTCLIISVGPITMQSPSHAATCDACMNVPFAEAQTDTPASMTVGVPAIPPLRYPNVELPVCAACEAAAGRYRDSESSK